MTAAVITVTKRGEGAGLPLANKTIRFFDVTANTGTYTTGGFTLTAAQFGLTSIDWAGVGSVATSGTAGATANPVGLQYAADGTSLTVQVYEAAATGLPLLEKSSDEAYVASFTFRLFVIGQ